MKIVMAVAFGEQFTVHKSVIFKRLSVWRKGDKRDIIIDKGTVLKKQHGILFNMIESKYMQNTFDILIIENPLSSLQNFYIKNLYCRVTCLYCLYPLYGCL